MIDTLYKCFQRWSENGSVYLISDTHFDDADCRIMAKDWISPETHIEKINKKVHRNDTLIHLGDVGNPEWMKQIKAHKVLIMGNHDETATQFEPYFDEIYTGPLMIAEKILLSHEPIEGITWAFNIHGHDHDPKNQGDQNHLNLAANVVNWEVISLKDIIKAGFLRHVKSLHRSTIDTATKKKKTRQKSENKLNSFQARVINAKRLNKYNLEVKDIKDLKIANREQINEPFWFNSAVGIYCLSKTIGIDWYWIGFYDDDHPIHPGETVLSCTSYDNMCSYNFRHFFSPAEIETNDDLEMQIHLVSTVTKLLDDGILVFKKERN